MALALRDVREHELDQVLALNNNAGPGILPIDSARLRHLFDIAAYFRVAEIDGHLAGFLIALTPEADYDSLNFRWFAANRDDSCGVTAIKRWRQLPRPCPSRRA